MAIVTYPLNGIMYNAENAETYLCTRTSGVYSADDNFSVQADGTMQVTVNPGLAWIKNGDFAGKSVVSTEPVILSFAMADGVLNRKDRIVLRFDVGENATNIVVKQGTPASTAEPKPIERTGTVYELGLYVVDIPAGTLGLSAANITSTMLDESVCGIMRDGVTGIPTAQLQEQAMALMEQVAESVNQWEQEQTAEFEEWFEGIKGALGEDVAGNLLNMIQQETADRQAADSAIESKLGINATAVYEESTVKITAPEGLVVVTFLAPSDCKAGDKYTLNGDALTLTDLNGEPVEDAWKQGSPVTLTLNGNKAFFKAGGGGKLPSDLAPLCPGFKVERNGGKVKISADKIQLNSYTNMVSGGVWAWGKTRPTKPTGENTKQWTRAELITTGKPYDGLYLGDVVPSDAVTETLLWLPENDSGSVKLVPFIVLSVDYLGGVYMMREPLSESMKATWGGSYYYPGNPVDSFLSATYLNSILDKSISDALLTCSVPVQTKFNTAAVETMDRKCWVPSYGELYDATFNDGTKMPYFNSTNRIAYINGGIVKGAYWTRTRAKGGSPYSVDTSGGMSNASGWSDTIYIRPSFVLPKDFKIQQRPDGSYTVWNEQGLMTLGDVEPSTGSQKVAFNILETIKTGLKTKYAEFVYGMKEYNGYSGGLLTRNDNGFASGKMYGALWTQTDAYNVLTQYATYEPSSLTLADRCLHSSIRKILMSVSVKSTDNGGAIHDNEVKCLLLSTREVNDGTYETGTPIPYYSVQANRIMKDASGVVTEAWLRDAPSSPSYQFRFIGQDGQIGTKVGGSTLEIVPSICVPLDTPIRALADGTYDLVPDDPALATQTVSTLADDEVPLEVEFDWPESDPLIARQWVYNEKGVYQTMLLGGVASTEDETEPVLDPVFGNNSWENIGWAARNNAIPDEWQIGDSKDEVINGETLTFAIMDFNHDDKADGSGKAPITMGMPQLMASTRAFNSSNLGANGSISTTELWNWLNSIVIPSLPEELQAYIVDVNKPTYKAGSSTLEQITTKAFLMSEKEVLNSISMARGSEGTLYPYYATSTNRIKKLSNGSGNANRYWLRSPSKNATGYICVITTSGSSESNGAPATTSLGISFGFCIG